MTDTAKVECTICHRKANPEELTTGTFLVAGERKTLPVHQRCRDQGLARVDRAVRKMQRKEAKDAALRHSHGGGDAA